MKSNVKSIHSVNILSDSRKMKRKKTEKTRQSVKSSCMTDVAANMHMKEFGNCKRFINKRVESRENAI